MARPKLDSAAKSYLLEYGKQYTVTVKTEAEIIALHQNSRFIFKNHIIDAVRNTRRKMCNVSWISRLGNVVGPVVLGIAIPLFIQEIRADNTNTLLVLLYALWSMSGFGLTLKLNVFAD